MGGLGWWGHSRASGGVGPPMGRGGWEGVLLTWYISPTVPRASRTFLPLLIMRASPSEEPAPHVPPLLCPGNSTLTLRTSSFSSPDRGSPGLWEPPVVLSPPPWPIGGCGHPKAQLAGPVPGALSCQHPGTPHTHSRPLSRGRTCSALLL